MTSRKPNPDFIRTCLWIIAKKPSFVSIGEFTSDYTVAIAHVKETKKKKKTKSKQKTKSNTSYEGKKMYRNL